MSRTETSSRVVLGLYLATLALLPWSWFPPFPWLHEHAQWSDVAFAVTAVAWLIEHWRLGRWPRFRPFHVAMSLYLGAATLSLLLATPASVRGTSAWKLLGLAELCLLAVITADLASRPRVAPAAARVVAGTSLAVAVAAAAGLLLFYAGVSTDLVGGYGDLDASRWYARVQAGLTHPHMLASFCIFAASVLARDDADLPPRLRRVAQAALWLTVGLTLSRAILGFVLAAVIRSARTRRERVLAGLVAALFAAILISLSLLYFRIDPTDPRDWRIDPGTPSRHSHKVLSSLRTLADHPLWGLGLNTHPAWSNGTPADTDVTLLNIAATLGLPALAAFSAMLVILWRTRGRPVDRATWSGLAGMALDSLAGDIEDFRHLWVMIGLADARSRDGSSTGTTSCSTAAAGASADG